MMVFNMYPPSDCVDSRYDSKLHRGFEGKRMHFTINNNY